MRAVDEERGKADKQNLPNGNVKKSKKKHEKISTQSYKNSIVGDCCQGVNWFNCCRDGSFEQNSVSEENKAGHEKKGMGKLSYWIGSWEQSDVLTAITVVGAVATVAVAYSFYRRSS